MFWLKMRRRRRFADRPLPEEWRRIIHRNVPYVSCLSEADHRELDGLIQIFLQEKHFEGAGGLEVTDEIRVTVAAQACVLILGRPAEIYPLLQSVIVYPHTYVAHSVRRQPDGTVSDGMQARLGESWSRGAIVLSWDNVLRSASDVHDGHNVVFHEFAHQLDADAGGSAKGAPSLPGRSMYVAWARVLGTDYERLVGDVSRHRPTFLDRYAGTSPAEFFAVATEFFFERPEALRAHHPRLYEQLGLFYRQDPAARPALPRAATSSRDQDDSDTEVASGQTFSLRRESDRVWRCSTSDDSVWIGVCCGCNETHGPRGVRGVEDGRRRDRHRRHHRRGGSGSPSGAIPRPRGNRRSNRIRCLPRDRHCRSGSTLPGVENHGSAGSPCQEAPSSIGGPPRGSHLHACS